MTPGGANRLLCDVLTTPDQYVVTIEDAGAHGASGIHVHDEPDSVVGVSVPQQVLWVHTMGMHECDVFGRRVRVRVFAGTDRRGLGTLAFDGRLNIASGALAIGDSRSPERQLSYGPPSIVGVGVFFEYAIEDLRLGGSSIGYPVSGPSDVNVLLCDDCGFAPAVAAVVRPWWRRLGSWHHSAHDQVVTPNPERSGRTEAIAAPLPVATLVKDDASAAHDLCAMSTSLASGQCCHGRGKSARIGDVRVPFRTRVHWGHSDG